MYTVRRTAEFIEWLTGLRDKPTRLRLTRRLQKAAAGNLGDSKPVGGGVFEMREAFGPGWRMYYVVRGTEVVVMLGGGDKSTQSRDIAAAQERAPHIKE